MKHRATAEQRIKALERRQKLRAIAKKISAMSEPERMALIDQWPTTIEGHRLSVHNACMILMQANGTQPTVLGGFRQWIKAGRCVKKGERGYGIWAPIGNRKPKADEIETAHEDSPAAFIVATVFDVSQTQDKNAASAEDEAVTGLPAETAARAIHARQNVLDAETPYYKAHKAEIDAEMYSLESEAA